MKNATTRPLKGSKPSGVSYIYILLFMFVIIGAGIVLSGGFVPVDPNGPGGPPSLPPYFNASDYGTQKIILPSNALTPDQKQNLQLKTFTVNTCGLDTAVDFLLDTSASMSDYGKIGKEKQGLIDFVKQLAGMSVVGIQTFSATVDDKVPLDYYKNNKDAVQTTIDNLSPQGWTRTRDGMELAEQDLSAAISANQYPGYHYALVLITDGVPEIPIPRTCEVQVPDPAEAPQERCFAQEEDPRVPTNIGDQIKALGVQIYTIALTGPPGTSDYALEPYLTAMLQNQASTPVSTHFFKTLNANNITQILDTVVNNICTDVTNQQLNGI